MVLGVLGRFDEDAVNAFAVWAGRMVSTAEFSRDANLRAALESLSEQRAPAFNAQTPDDRRVHYQSWAVLRARLKIGKAAKE